MLLKMLEKSRNHIGELLAPFIMLAIIMAFQPRQLSGEINVKRLADAIKVEEGNRHPYGIKSVHCSSESDCRSVCIKTIKHQFKNFTKSHQTGIENFINYLAKIYDAGDSRDEQKRWIVNVELIYFNKSLSRNNTI